MFLQEALPRSCGLERLGCRKEYGDKNHSHFGHDSGQNVWGFRPAGLAALHRPFFFFSFILVLAGLRKEGALFIVSFPYYLYFNV